MRNRLYSVMLLVAPVLMFQDDACQPGDMETNLLELNARNPIAPGRSSLRGLYNLNTEAVRQNGGWKDTLLVGDDLPPNPDEPYRPITHGLLMYEVIRDMGIPTTPLSFSLGLWIEGNLHDGNDKFNRLVSGDYEPLRTSARVVHLPIFTALFSDSDVANVLANDHILFVIAVGNSYLATSRGFPNQPWDVWRPDHPFWDQETNNFNNPRFTREAYNNIQRLVQSGRVLFATSANVRDGVMVPERTVMRCGSLKDACFTMLPEEGLTSSASARLAAMAFYLSQFYRTPEEVVSVLKGCAIDVGEPGTDIEYGLGVANLLCAPVLQREIDAYVATQSAPALRNASNLFRAFGSGPEAMGWFRAAVSQQ